MTDQERVMLFIRGFGDGARFGAYKHPDSADYMEGWAKGEERVRIAAIQFQNRHGLRPNPPTRTE